MRLTRGLWAIAGLLVTVRAATDASQTTCTSFTNGTTWGEDDLRTIRITAKDAGGSIEVGTSDVFIVDVYTHNPVCTPTLATPDCVVNCSPYERPHQKSPSCTSRPRVPYPIRDAQAQWASVIADPKTGGYYDARYEPEVKGRYDIDVALMQQGGLNAYYFDNVWFVDLPDFHRIDKTVNFQWGDGVITTYGKDYISIRWSGKFKPDFTEQYTIFAYADDGVRVWVDKQLIIDQWSTCCNETYNTVELTQGHYHDIIVEYQELKDQAQIELRWASFSTPKQIIPSTHLFYRQYTCSTPYSGFTYADGPPPHHLDMRHQEVTVGPSKMPNANYTYSYNFGNHTGRDTAEVGIPATYQVQLVDIFNNSLERFYLTTESNVKFTFVPAMDKEGYTGEEDPSHIHNSMNHWPTQENGVWQFNYTGQKSGQYYMHIQTNDTGTWDDLIGSPFWVNMSCGPTSVPNSYYFGDGAVNSQAGHSAFFYIQARDQFDNNRTSEGDNIWVVMAGTAPLHAAVEYQNIGLYRILYTPKLEGTYQTNMYMNAELFSAQSMPVTMNAAEDVIYYPYCTASSLNLNNATAGLNVSVAVSFYDQFNNSVDISALEAVSLQIIGPRPYNTTRDVTGAMAAIVAGDQIMSYKPILTGEFDLHVRISGDDVVNSPFTLYVAPGVPQSWKTTAYGDLITGSMQGEVSVETTIYIQAKDSEENLLDSDFSPSLTAELICGADTRLGTTTYTGMHGLHKVVITPTIKGAACTVKVKVSGIEIAHSPYSVKIIPGHANHNSSTFEVISSGTAGVNIKFDINAIDVHGNNLDSDTANTRFLVDVYGPNYDTAEKAPYGVMANIKNSENATYHADWTPMETGNYQAYVHVMDRGVGLTGKYYKDMFFSENALYLTRIDQQINFDWGYHNPFGDDTIFPTEYWGVQWHGNFRAEKSETYRIYADLEPNCGVRIWLNESINGITMARNFPKYAEFEPTIIDEFDPNQGGTEVFADVLLNKDIDYEILIQYRDYTGKASLKLHWESPSTSKRLIPGSAYSTLRNVTGSPHNVLITSAATYHNTSTTVRSGDLKVAYSTIASGGHKATYPAGVDVDFHIQLRDEFGNLRLVGGEQGSITVTLDEIFLAHHTAASSISDLSNGTYRVVYKPNQTGDCYLNVKFQGQPILGSPFTVNVHSGVAVPAQSWAEGTGYHNGTANYEAKFRIYLRDIMQNMRQYSDNVICHAAGPAPVEISVVEVGGGIYKATYTPTVSGTYTIQCVVNGVNIPTTGTAVIVADIASAVHSTFVLTNSTGGVVITTTDNQGNDLAIGGHRFWCEAVKTYDGTLIRGDVTDNTDGTYAVAFTAPSGHYMMTIKLAKGRDAIGDGLTGKYYTNPWLSGDPVLTRVDPYVNFAWGVDLVTPTAKDYISVEWTGYIRPEYAEVFIFTLEADDGIRLTVDETLVIDKWMDSANTFTGNYTFPVANELYSIKLEYRETTNIALCKMFWQSATQAYGLITQNYLHSRADDLIASPIRFVSP